MAVEAGELELYTPLDSTERQIRLLRISTSDENTPSTKVFSLQTFSLNDEPKYQALSYCWGQEKAQHSISINGTLFQVRPNLYEYLTLMHEENQQEWIFIDAICINQDDILERSSQVALMGDLYRDAFEVVAWIGNRDPTGYSTIPLSRNLLMQWQTWFDETLRFMNHRQNNETSRDLEERQRPTPPSPTEDPEAPAHFMALVSNIAEQPYWHRLWVIQEMTLAFKLTIRYKCLQMDGAILHACFEGAFKDSFKSGGLSSDTLREILQYSSVSMDWPHGPEVRQAFHVLFLFRERAQNNKLARARELLLNRAVLAYADQECFILNDKIFGLLGMTTTLIKPDYERPTSGIYINALIQGLWEIQAEHSAGNFGDQPNSRKLQEQSAQYTLRLAKSLGMQLYQSTTRFNTQEILKLFGTTPDLVFKLWATRVIDPSGSFIQNKVFGKALHTHACLLTDRMAKYRYKLSTATGFLDSEYMETVVPNFRMLFDTTGANILRFRELHNQLLTLQSMSLEEVKTLVQAVTDFPGEGGAARLSIVARQQLMQRHDSLAEMLKTRPEIGHQVDLERMKVLNIWHSMVQGLLARGVNVFLGSKKEHEALQKMRIACQECLGFGWAELGSDLTALERELNGPIVCKDQDPEEAEELVDQIELDEMIAEMRL